MITNDNFSIFFIILFWSIESSSYNSIIHKFKLRQKLDVIKYYQKPTELKYLMYLKKMHAGLQNPRWPSTFFWCHLPRISWFHLKIFSILCRSKPFSITVGQCKGAELMVEVNEVPTCLKLIKTDTAATIYVIPITLYPLSGNCSKLQCITGEVWPWVLQVLHKMYYVE